MDPAPTFKNNSHSERRLLDMQDIFLESLDNSEHNQHRCILIFLENFALQVVAASGLYCCKWPLQVVDIAASCKKAASG